MSKVNLDQFMNQVADSEELQTRIGEEIDADSLIALGAEHGCEFSAEELTAGAELSDEELDEVAAGTGKNSLVQYKESDLNFVDRLAEHEGISYYFQNSNSENRMLLARFHSPSLNCTSSDHMAPMAPLSKRHFSACCFSSLDGLQVV